MPFTYANFRTASTDMPGIASACHSSRVTYRCVERLIRQLKAQNLLMPRRQPHDPVDPNDGVHPDPVSGHDRTVRCQLAHVPCLHDYTTKK